MGCTEYARVKLDLRNIWAISDNRVAKPGFSRCGNTALNLLCIGGYLYTIHQAQHSTTSTRQQTVIIRALSSHLAVDYKTRGNEPEQQ